MFAMRRRLFFAYGVGNYLLFFGSYAYLACFVGDLFVSRTIDSGPTTPPALAAAIDLALLLLFALQHSVMARPAFKARWTRLVPQPIERSTYMLASCLVLVVLMWLWQPINVVVWNITNPVGRWLMLALFVAGWLLVPLVSLAISHFDLFGVRQVWLHLMGRPYTPLAFRTPLPYNLVRHPLYIGWAIAFWATPTMTLGHLLFAGTMTGYMGLAALIEERDLVNYFGPQYEDYRHKVPMFVPRLTPATAHSQKHDRHVQAH
jgi:protein-S-isoprenylcysteine O-methyltransferase Ste14